MEQLGCARWPHKPEDAGSNPATATYAILEYMKKATVILGINVILIYANCFMVLVSEFWFSVLFVLLWFSLLILVAVLNG